MDLWDKTVTALRDVVKPYDFMHWIRPVNCEAIDDQTHEIVLTVPDDSHGRWLEEHFLSDIQKTLRDISETDYDVRFRCLPEATDASKSSPARPTPGRPAGPSRAAPDQPDLVARYTFDTFVDGPNSRFALTASQAVAESPGVRYNPMCIYGGVGLGKTHLLHAVGHAVLAANPEARVLYVTSERFVNDLIGAIRTNEMDAFRTRYRDRCDVLLIDDIQFMAGKDRTQEEFFHLFNTLHSSHKQIVMTSDALPQAIPNMEERLKSRLQWGLIADIKPPGFETRVAILKGKAEADGVYLDDEVAMLLARHITRNVRELEGALMRLEANARLFGQRITVEMTQAVLGDLVEQGHRQIAPDTIAKAVSNAFQVPMAALKGPRRHRQVTVPRQVAMFLIRELTDASLPQIGTLFGGRDHTTVINALKRIESLREADLELREQIDRLRLELTR
ncbi:MAG: chromosomal replication initiator protein DnaA [Deltaproteobacteria bacterium]|nr:chromosomal replication initiator protein DnaA [Deltaproteobacteria bacterium]MCB9785610.1 chromosomal replication initiator protein DnaA [Deltaproteobacteria bacterium]